ncbi:MAG: hypothetical protein K0U93_25870 [Gammaproteobacteria bacterium]|nr:hypothetical protein [Gammaproteobacteria bacterium]
MNSTTLGSEWNLAVKYQYTVQGNLRGGSNERLRTFSERRLAEQEPTLWPQGKAIDVYYYPKAPHRSSLCPIGGLQGERSPLPWRRRLQSC